MTVAMLPATGPRARTRAMAGMLAAPRAFAEAMSCHRPACARATC